MSRFAPALCKRLATAALIALPFVLAGCGETVQFEGRIFDMLGVNDTSKRQDNAVPVRPPLVVPPNPDDLPQPGSIAESDQNMNWPDDPDKRRAAIAAAEKDENKKYDFTKAINPSSKPQKGILTRSWNNQTEADENAGADVPRPELDDPDVVN